MKHFRLAQPFQRITHFLAPFFWFFAGFTIAAVTLICIIVIYFQHSYHQKVIPGVFVDNIYIGEKTDTEVRKLFDGKNERLHKTTFQLQYQDSVATISAKELNIGYDTNLIVDQALSLGKSPDLFSDISLIIDSYLNGTVLRSSYTFDTDKIKEKLASLDHDIYKEPVDALFTVTNNRVTAFRQSSNGQAIDYATLSTTFRKLITSLVKSQKTQTITLQVPVTIIKPDITTQKANNLGIVEEIGEGVSYYAGSIENRVHNISLAASRINGVLVAPDEVFSFDKSLGNIDRYNGYKEAYVIQNGKTVLGDGGGVCQVSTTLFRAVLNAGLPIVERHAHAYRVGYYEQNSSPGIDATIYVPTVDFKFRNDTGHSILIQTQVDLTNMSLTFVFYGTKDGREVSMTKPVITSQTAPPEPLYQDDPTLPSGTVTQVEHAAYGANISFSRTVTKNGKVLYSDVFSTHYQPWRAVFLKGTRT
jgi:vancomycin resistance protein YoaR